LPEPIKPKQITLRPVLKTDLPIFFTHQSDPSAIFMAAFTAEDPTNRKVFISHWRKILKDKTIQIQTILFEDHIAGHIEQFMLLGLPSIGYWIGKEFWGLGIATKALHSFLNQTIARPLYARVVKDNLSSMRVLEKNGFVKVGQDKGYAHGRGNEVDEWIYKLT